MAKNTPYTPIKDGVKSDNSTYSSNQIDRMISEVEGSIPDLPEAATSDIGKVLGIVSDGSTGAEYGLVNAPSSDVDYAYLHINFSFDEQMQGAYHYQRTLGTDSDWQDFATDYNDAITQGKYPVVAIHNQGMELVAYSYLIDGKEKPSLDFGNRGNPKFYAFSFDLTKIYIFEYHWVVGVPMIPASGSVTVKTITTT